ncbi:hypothetical protein C8F01DRAFT_1368634 [Mycena amicta]|nr:hypothetical protein C8F01DRAFT_1368634 [Mycena amicta]
MLPDVVYTWAASRYCGSDSCRVRPDRLGRPFASPASAPSVFVAPRTRTKTESRSRIETAAMRIRARNCGDRFLRCLVGGKRGERANTSSESTHILPHCFDAADPTLLCDLQQRPRSANGFRAPGRGSVPGLCSCRVRRNRIRVVPLSQGPLVLNKNEKLNRASLAATMCSRPQAGDVVPRQLVIGGTRKGRTEVGLRLSGGEYFGFEDGRVDEES